MWLKFGTNTYNTMHTYKAIRMNMRANIKNDPKRVSTLSMYFHFLLHNRQFIYEFFESCHSAGIHYGLVGSLTGGSRTKVSASAGRKFWTNVITSRVSPVKQLSMQPGSKKKTQVNQHFQSSFSYIILHHQIKTFHFFPDNYIYSMHFSEINHRD